MRRELGAKTEFAQNNFWRNDANVDDDELAALMKGEDWE